MSRVYRISLICVMVVAMIALCILLYRYKTDDLSSGPESYPGVAEHEGTLMDPANSDHENETPNMDLVLLTTTDTAVITNAGTELIIIEIFPAGIRKESRMELPEQLEGLDRTKIVEILEEYSGKPDTIDIEKGLYRIEMTQFSSETVTIEKYYHKEALDYYYLAFMDDCVIVFCEDKATILLKTDIHRDQLPGYLREEILNYKLLAGNAELFAFLETYTS